MDPSRGSHGRAMQESRETKELRRGSLRRKIPVGSPAHGDWIRGYLRGSKKKLTIEF